MRLTPSPHLGHGSFVSRAPRGPAITVAILTLLSGGLAAGASADCPEGDAWVRVGVGEGWDESTREAVLADLRAELAPRRIEVCEEDAPDGAAPLAEIRLERPDDGEVVSVLIEVRDAVTDKRVGRDVSLADVPEAGRALTIALAVVELLRASWIELRLRRAPAPARPVPAAVEEVVEEVEAEIAESGPPANGLGLAGLFEHSVGGLTQVGGALRYQRWLIDELAIGLSAGGRYGLPMRSDQGRIETMALSGGLDLRVAFSPRREVFYVGVDVSARLLVLRFAATGEAGFRGGEATDVGLSVRAAFLGRVRIADALGVEASIGVGVPVIALVAEDGDGPVGGLSTFEVVASLGPVLEL